MENVENVNDKYAIKTCYVHLIQQVLAGFWKNKMLFEDIKRSKSKGLLFQLVFFTWEKS